MTPPLPPTPDRHGVALALVLLVTLALAVMAHASLALAGTEARIARLEARRVAMDREAAAAVAQAELLADSLPPAGDVPLPAGRARASRLSAEVVLLTGWTGDTSWAPRRARILWAPDPHIRLSTRRAWLQAGVGVEADPGALVESAPEPSPCPDGNGPVQGRPDWGLPPEFGPHPGLGPVPLNEMVARVGGRPPGPLALDSALTVAVEGDASARGDGSGVILVDGSLNLDPGTQFRGWLWVAGDLVVRSGARLTGLADVGGSIRVESQGVIHTDPCAAMGALGASSALRRPWGVGPLAWPA